MQVIDITTGPLKGQGYEVKKEGITIVLSENGSIRCRFGIYRNDWNKTIKKTEEKLADAGIEPLVIQAIVASMSSNYPKLMNGRYDDSDTTVKRSLSDNRNAD